MTSEIDKLKHFHIEDYSGTAVFASLFGYLNPYYRSAYNIPKRRK